MTQDPEHTPQELQSRFNEPPSGENLERLRELLFGHEIRELSELRDKLNKLDVTAESLADQLPSAVVIRTKRDDQLAEALSTTIEDSLHTAVKRNPQKVTDAIFPILGPAIRKAIAETMAGLVQTINGAIESSLSIQGLKWRFEAWRTGVPYGQVVIRHALLYRVEQIFLIHAETGLLLSHVTADGVETPDADIISGMLTAVKDFVQDSFRADVGYGMRRLSVAEHTIFAQSGPRATLGAVIRGQAPEELNQRLAEILERIHLHFGPALAAFEGDSTPFEQTKPVLATGLETQLMTDRAGRARWPRRLAWGIIGLMILASTFLFVRSSVRWNRAVAMLEDAPGIVVIENSRGLRGGAISGLLDPGAPEPISLMDAAGIDTTRIDARWTSYLSLDSSVMRARVVRFLNVPTGVSVAVTDAGVRLTGSADPQWLLHAATLRHSIPGITTVDLTALSVLLPPNLGTSQKEIGERRIGFSIGSAELDPVAQVRIDSLTLALTTVEREAVSLGLTTIISLVGRSDTTGTLESNSVLSQRRAEAVRTAFISRGVSGDRITATGIATASPLAALTSTETAQLNRSVTLDLQFVMTHTLGDASR